MNNALAFITPSSTHKSVKLQATEAPCVLELKPNANFHLSLQVSNKKLLISDLKLPWTGIMKLTKSAIFIMHFITKLSKRNLFTFCYQKMKDNIKGLEITFVVN